MKFIVSARGGKAPLLGHQQIADTPEGAIEMRRMMNELFDGTALIVVTDEKGVVISPTDLPNFRGISPDA